jgi:hypothetical protein
VGEKRITYKYSIGFKRKVVEEIERGKISGVYEASRIYDIEKTGPGTAYS